MTTASCAIEEITPEIAKQWLGVNHRNRRLSNPTVTRLAGIILRDEWMEDCTDAIGLDTDEGVINGQHRLNAIIAADRAVRALVLRNVNPDVIKIIDQGMHRTFGQLLDMNGYDYYNVIAGAVDWIYKMTNDYERSTPTAARATVPQLLDVFNEHPKVVNSLDPAFAAWQKTRVDRSILTAYHYAFASVDDEAADLFFEQLATGIGVGADTPVYTLRERYLAEQAKADGKKEQKYVLAAWLVKAWEATRRGETMTSRQLRWTKSGPRAEAFPKVSNVSWLPTGTDEPMDLGAS
jgi:hypothetical protein